ncbi:MAG: CARDB domain-containing protein [Solirubrobacterales bacterium]
MAIAATASLSMAGGAAASGEVASADLKMTPQSGQLYTDVKKPVNWRVDVEITAPYPANPSVLPMKQVTIDFPKDMSFNPKSNTPVCADDKVGPNANLSFPPDTIIARCPTAVLGNGTSGLYLAKANGAAGPNLTDPVLIVFNGGKNSKGQPRLKIYGYSAGTGAGIYMEGALIDGKLDIKIPVLSFDSAVGDFNLNIPGSSAPEANRRGVDKTYVQSTCSKGKWLTNASFVLGTRDSAGSPTSPDTFLDAPEVTTACAGVPGSKLGTPKVSGPSKVKKGKKGTYKVTIKNTGGVNVGNVKVVASGKGVKGSVKAGNIAKGKSKTVKVKVKFNKKGKIKTTFKVTGADVSAKSVSKSVKVK